MPRPFFSGFAMSSHTRITSVLRLALVGTIQQGVCSTYNAYAIRDAVRVGGSVRGSSCVSLFESIMYCSSSSRPPKGFTKGSARPLHHLVDHHHHHQMLFCSTFDNAGLFIYSSISGCVSPDRLQMASASKTIRMTSTSSGRTSESTPSRSWCPIANAKRRWR